MPIACRFAASQICLVAWRGLQGPFQRRLEQSRVENYLCFPPLLFQW